MKLAGKTIFRAVMIVFIFLSSVGTVLAKDTGPSSSQSPFLMPSQPGVSFKALLTVGDSVNAKPDGTPYRMVGLPDGLGAFDNKDGTFTLLMNHELNGSVGIPRAHGAPGAFISKWIIRKRDLKVVSGEDLIRNVMVWNAATNQYEPATTTFSRFCSADLPAVSAFYDSRSRRGYKGLIYMNGEEAGAEGRAFAHLMDGTSYELPRLGKFSWENSVANPGTRRTTVVAGLDDSGGGQVYFYVGRKTRSSNPVEAAGLTNGNLFSIKVEGLDSETNDTVLEGPVPFTAYNFGDVSSMTGAELEAASRDETGAYRVTSFQRPEDGVWDPEDPDDFYFVTTAGFTGNSRLWKVHFHNPADPEEGGTLEMLLDGSEGQKMMDNIAINSRGQILIQEDPGNQPYLARIWLYDIKRDTLTEIAQHDPERFTPGAAGFLTQDEESSGMIEVASILGKGWYLLVQQTHFPSPDAELVEGGQLLAMRISREREHEDD
jgi:hypothetical protein